MPTFAEECPRKLPEAAHADGRLHHLIYPKSGAKVCVTPDSSERLRRVGFRPTKLQFASERGIAEQPAEKLAETPAETPSLEPQYDEPAIDVDVVDEAEPPVGTPRRGRRKSS